jgi:hypothetical protein
MTSIAALIKFCKGNQCAFDSIKCTGQVSNSKLLGKKRKPDTSLTYKEQVVIDDSEKLPKKDMITNKGSIRKIQICADDKNIVSDIESIVESFYESFNEGDTVITKEDILNCLKINSFNIVNAYLYLKDPEQFTSKLFFH